MKDGKIGWIKADYDYDRENNGMSGHAQGIVASIVEANKAAVEAALKKEFSSWSGKGKVTINWVEFGPFREDREAVEAEAFKGMVIEFDN